MHIDKASVLKAAIVAAAVLFLLGMWRVATLFCLDCSPPGPDAVALNPSGTRVYVAVRDDRAVSVIDATLNKKVAVVPLPIQVRSLITKPSDSRLYVLGWEPQTDPIVAPLFRMVAIIDTNGNALLGTTVVVVEGEEQVTRVLRPDSVSSRFRAALRPFAAELFDSHSGKIVTLPVDAWSRADEVTAMSRSGKRIYVARTSSETLEEEPLPGGGSKILKQLVRGEVLVVTQNVQTGRVQVFEAVFTIGSRHPNFGGLALSASKNHIYAGVRLGKDRGFVAVIDASTEESPRVIARIPLEFDPTGTALEPSETNLYVAQTNYGPSLQNGVLSVIDISTYKLVSTIPVGKWPNEIAISPSGERIYVANAESGTLSVIDFPAKRVIATIKVKRERP